MDFASSERAGAQPKEITSAKIVVAGGFGVGKTTLVGAVSEIEPLTTEAVMTSLGEGIDDASKVPGKGKRRRRAAKAAVEAMSLSELEQTIVELEEEMLAAAEELRFEYAAKLRDEIRDLRTELQEATAPS